MIDEVIIILSRKDKVQSSKLRSDYCDYNDAYIVDEEI